MKNIFELVCERGEDHPVDKRIDPHRPIQPGEFTVEPEQLDRQDPIFTSDVQGCAG